MRKYILIFLMFLFANHSWGQSHHKIDGVENLLFVSDELLKLQIVAGIILIGFLIIIIFLFSKKNKITNRLNALLEEKNKIINERNYQLSLKNKKISDQNIELNYKHIQIKKLLKKYEEQDNEKQTSVDSNEFKRTKTFENFEFISLETQLEEALSLLDKKLSNIKVSTIVEENLSLCYCNYQEMISVWTNLLENSIASISEKGHIQISISSNDEYIVVNIKDNGHGIEESEYGNIFKPFVSYNNNIENKGLGLYIVKKILEKHSGDILVKSEVNNFTEFSVFLPIRQ